MIFLDLGTEPDVLSEARAERRLTAVTEFNSHGSGVDAFTDSLVGYDACKGGQRVKLVLQDRQRNKCAWCEKSCDWENYPVEHIRPKKRADEVDSSGELVKDSADHYWWLAWSWENLVFSCFRCNSSKSTRFPMKPGTLRVTPPRRPLTAPVDWSLFDVSGEKPLLISPRDSRCDPLDHLRWAIVDVNVKPERWIWTIVGRSEEGEMTIQVLGLKKRSNDVGVHLKAAVGPMWTQITDHMRAKRWKQARQAWVDLVTATVEMPAAPFRAAAWWTLNQLCDESLRRKLGFADPPRPRVCAP